MEANTMIPDHIAPKRAVWSGSILFVIYIPKIYIQMSEQRIRYIMYYAHTQYTFYFIILGVLAVWMDASTK